MGIWDNETLAKLRAMKNKMLGLDEKNIDSGIEKDKERGEPLSKITRTYFLHLKLVVRVLTYSFVGF